MPEFALVPGPILAPGRCLGCGQSAGRMVDLMIRPDDASASPYLCPLCVGEAASLLQWSPPEVFHESQLDMAALAERVTVLEAELEAEKANKVLTVSDAIKLAEWKGRIDEAREERKDHEEEWLDALQPTGETIDRGWLPTCTATKVDGSACTAKALPGRDVCVAHSKQKQVA